jgi:hypothetical protein
VKASTNKRATTYFYTVDVYEAEERKNVWQLSDEVIYMLRQSCQLGWAGYFWVRGWKVAMATMIVVASEVVEHGPRLLWVSILLACGLLFTRPRVSGLKALHEALFLTKGLTGTEPST